MCKCITSLFTGTTNSWRKHCKANLVRSKTTSKYSNLSPSNHSPTSREDDPAKNYPFKLINWVKQMLDHNMTALDLSQGI